MPLNSRDRFFSSHTDTHYALYLWQPNRSAWGEDEPIEALAIWDISSPSPYRPSEDPTSKGKPSESLEGPKILRRFSFADLGFYKIRQLSEPTLRGLELDENHVYVIQEDHRWIVGQQASSVLPRLHRVKSTGIPFFGGPHWEDQCGADGDVNLSFCERASDVRSPNLAPCWRHEVGIYPMFSPRHPPNVLPGISISYNHRGCGRRSRCDLQRSSLLYAGNDIHQHQTKNPHDRSWLRNILEGRPMATTPWERENMW